MFRGTDADVIALFRSDGAPCMYPAALRWILPKPKMGISEVDTTGIKLGQYLTECLVEQGGQLEAPTDYITLR